MLIVGWAIFRNHLRFHRVILSRRAYKYVFTSKITTFMSRDFDITNVLSDCYKTFSFPKDNSSTILSFFRNGKHLNQSIIELTFQIESRHQCKDINIHLLLIINYKGWQQYKKQHLTILICSWTLDHKS